MPAQIHMASIFSSSLQPVNLEEQQRYIQAFTLSLYTGRHAADQPAYSDMQILSLQP